ncbi:MAG: hypothetical protein LBL52_03510, partial [Rickettsiales bacterium]|nr:hypothetical protein [Rickettsiales bacterium]
MKRLLAVLLCFSTAAMGAKATSSASKSKGKFTTAVSENLCVQEINYCFDYHCWGRDVGDKTKTNVCYSKGVAGVVSGVEDCLDRRGAIKQANYRSACKVYTYKQVEKLMGSMSSVDAMHAQATPACQREMKRLEAAKKCYAVMISHDGSIDLSLRLQLSQLCGPLVGGNEDMVERFYRAGDYGDANLGAQADMLKTGQITAKQANWRQVVDAALAGYIEVAENACGREDYRITKVNEYAAESRTNLAYTKARAEAEQEGRAMGNRVVNNWFRRTDCENSPLPKGGKGWRYIYRGNPDCRIVCLDGYVQGKDTSTCVPAVAEKEDETWMGLNVRGEYRESVKENPIEIRHDKKCTPPQIPDGQGGCKDPDTPPNGEKKHDDQIIVPSGTDGLCDKTKLTQIPGQFNVLEQICELFKLGPKYQSPRWYYRVEEGADARVPGTPVYSNARFNVGNAENKGTGAFEYFCFAEPGKEPSAATHWAKISNADIRKILGLTSLDVFGNEYRSGTSYELKKACNPEPKNDNLECNKWGEQTGNFTHSQQYEYRPGVGGTYAGKQGCWCRDNKVWDNTVVDVSRNMVRGCVDCPSGQHKISETECSSEQKVNYANCPPMYSNPVPWHCLRGWDVGTTEAKRRTQRNAICDSLFVRSGINFTKKPYVQYCDGSGANGCGTVTRNPNADGAVGCRSDVSGGSISTYYCVGASADRADYWNFLDNSDISGAFGISSVDFDKMAERCSCDAQGKTWNDNGCVGGAAPAPCKADMGGLNQLRESEACPCKDDLVRTPAGNGTHCCKPGDSWSDEKKCHVPGVADASVVATTWDNCERTMNNVQRRNELAGTGAELALNSKDDVCRALFRSNGIPTSHNRSSIWQMRGFDYACFGPFGSNTFDKFANVSNNKLNSLLGTGQTGLL